MDLRFTVLRKLMCIWAVWIAAGFLLCCSHARIESNHEQTLLTGTFRLQIRSSCVNRGLQKDELILHGDGRLEQHSVLASGKRYDSTNGSWSYFPQNSVSLQNWMDFTDNPSRKPTSAVLLANFGNPPSILVNPDSDCVYVKQ